MTQQEEDRLNHQPTSVTAGFSNAIVDSIVHEKNAIIHQSKWDPSNSLHLKMNQSMIKTVLRISLQQTEIPLTDLDPNIEYRLGLTI